MRNGELDASFFYGDLAQPRGRPASPLRPLVYRVAAPAALARAAIAGADWPDVAALPWILTPPISSHNRLVQRAVPEHGVEPTKVVEADQESVISSLVASGVGLSLMREDVALAREAAGEICLWDQGRGTTTTLWFIYPQERPQDPVILALLDGLRDTWDLREEQVAPLPQARGAALRTGARYFVASLAFACVRRSISTRMNAFWKLTWQAGARDLERDRLDLHDRDVGGRGDRRRPVRDLVAEVQQLAEAAAAADGVDRGALIETSTSPSTSR